MNVWVKLLIGSILGIFLGWFLPSDNQTVMGVLAWLLEMGIRIGRYMVIPILAFSMTIAVYELRKDGIFWRLIAYIFLMIVACTFLVIMAGVLVMQLFPAIRIPILTGEQAALVSFNPLENITGVFPYNMFSVLASDGIYFFPVCVFAFFLGIGLSYDRNFTRPVIAFIDSLSRIFFYISAFFVEILGLVMIVISAYWAVQYRNALSEGIFGSIILLLGILSLVLGFILLPLFFFFIGGGKNPWSVLRGSLGIACTGFFSGDLNFTIPVILHQIKENLGVRRKISAVTVPLFATFCRAGSAMVAVIALIVVVQSYSSLKLNFPDMLLIGLKGCVISMILARYPGTGAYTALAFLSMDYGSGFEAGYIIFKPIAFYLITIGTFLDVMIASFASYSLSKTKAFQNE